MNSEEFVDTIRRIVRDQAAAGVADLIKSPPGRVPDGGLVEISKWFDALDFESKRMVEVVIAMACDHATFGFLCVLDGTRKAFADSGAKIELRYVNANENILLNDPRKTFLHDLL